MADYTNQKFNFRLHSEEDSIFGLQLPSSWNEDKNNNNNMNSSRFSNTMSTTNLYLEEKEDESYDDDQIVADEQWKSTSHRGNPKSQQPTHGNAFLCAAPSYESELKLNHVDLFLDGLMDSFLPCNSSEASLDITNPLTSPPPLGFASATTPSRGTKPNRPARGKTTGKMFKLIKVKRGENIGLQICEISTRIYISNVAKDGTGLKRGMRVIAINDRPCPDSVGQAIHLMAHRDKCDDGYVTLVTAEDHDFAAAAAAEDEGSIQTDVGYV